jgi:tripartite-type tricarboxylate transporter receptor subunit TctC
LPEVPTFLEQGFKTIEVREWFGFFMPGATPSEVLSDASSAVRRALSQKDLIETLSKLGMSNASSTPAELAKKLRSEHDYWGPVIKAAGFTAES